MKFLLLRLKGPLQSWGSASRFGMRDTADFPSLSGVIGLLGSAMGYTRDSKELIDLLSPLTIAVRIDKPGRRMRDYQIIDTGGSNGKKISERFYLSDAAFFVLVYDPLQKSDAILDSVAESLSMPANPLFLGRKSCPPSEYISLGIHDKESLTEALAMFPELENAHGKKLKAWIPGNSGKHATLVNDVPLNFSMTNRSYSTRLISQIDINMDPKLGPEELDPFDIIEEQ